MPAALPDTPTRITQQKHLVSHLPGNHPIYVPGPFFIGAGEAHGPLMTRRRLRLLQALLPPD